MSHNAEPFHNTNAIMSTPATSRDSSAVSSIGSPTLAVIAIPTRRDPQGHWWPDPVGGRVRHPVSVSTSSH
jgi:hypothetical protein